MALVCPQCGKDDMVQKVSSIFSSGIASSQYSGPTGGLGVPVGSGKPFIVGGYTKLKGTSQTELSRKLAPPQRPKRPNNCLLILAVVVLVIIGLNCARFGSSAGKGNSGGGILICIISWVIAAALIVYNNSEYRKRLPEIESAEKKWQIAMSRWNDLYYCARNDCVFNPDEGLSVSADKINDLIYR